LLGEGQQLRKKSGHAAGEKHNFENDGGGSGFEKERDGLTQVVPQVGAFSFIKSRKLNIFGFGLSD
jgi:hypothetical protein